MRSTCQMRMSWLLLLLSLSCVWLAGCSSTPNVFWTEFASGTVNKIVGTAPPVLLTSGQPAAAGIGVDAANVYWASSANGTISRMPQAGGTPIVLASGQVGALGLTVDPSGEMVYWTNTGDGTIRSIPANGGPVKILAQGQGDPLSIAVDGQNIYWTDPGKGTVMQCPKTSCSPSNLVTLSSATTPSTPALPWGIAIDFNNVYWTDSYARTVNQVPIGGGSTTVLANMSTGAFANTAGIAVDSKNVYFVDAGGSNSVYRVPIGGGTVTLLAPNQGNPAAIALSETNVYWGNYTGQIYSIAKNCTAPCTPALIANASEPAAIAVVNVVSWGPAGCGSLIAPFNWKRSWESGLDRRILATRFRFLLRRKAE
jgi:hypothetical protein